jgi:alpha-beta hydrolase superfamily lysophospholipase
MTTLTTSDRPVAAAWDGPAHIAPRGTLIVIPGRGEHPALYERFGSRLAFDAYQVRAVTAPTADEDTAREQVKSLLRDPSLARPHVLVGSDAGALVALSLAATEPVDGVIVAGLPVAPAAASPVATDWDAELEQRTACPTHRGRLAADDSFQRGALDEPLPSAWLADGDPGAVRVPVLGLHGENDTVSPVGVVRALFGNAANATLVTLADGRHDALNDATHRTSAATVVLFLERLRLGADLPLIATQR